MKPFKFNYLLTVLIDIVSRKSLLKKRETSNENPIRKVIVEMQIIKGVSEEKET